LFQFLKGIVKFLSDNKEWLLSGVGIVIIGFVFKGIAYLVKNNTNHRGKIKIKVSFSQAWVQSILGQGPVFPLITFEITNVGNSEVNIKDVLLFFCGKKVQTQYGKTQTLTEVGSNPNLRTPIKSGEIKKGQFEISGIQRCITQKISQNKKVRLLVIDTFGNKYFSKKIAYKSFVNNMTTSNMVNAKRN
jgi:hypothetical protein